MFSKILAYIQLGLNVITLFRKKAAAPVAVPAATAPVATPAPAPEEKK